jgi:16S rRNA processing protein RimM
LDYYLIARIDQLYGKDGFIILKLFSDFPERFLDLKKVYIDFWGDKKTFYIEDVKDVKGKIIIKFENFSSRRELEVLLGREIFVTEENVARLPENQFFIHDLIGIEVFAGSDKLGNITDVIKSKANDVLVINTEDNEEKLMPFVLNFIEKFDAERKRLILNVSKDFFEDDED